MHRLFVKADKLSYEVIGAAMRNDKGLNGDLDRLPMLTWILFLKLLDDSEHLREEKAKLKGERFRPAIAAPYRWRDWAANEAGITGDELRAFINNDEITKPDGQKMPPHRERSIRVLVKERGKWLTTAFHNTIVRDAEPLSPR